jgi:histidinol-phosphate/aromatic aminotransferase/cobyric acid decarboxylase-like protein
MSGIPPAGVHGGDGARLAAALGVDVGDVLDLSASMNPVAPEPAGVVGRHLDALGRYPDPGRATAALAEAMAVDRRHLLLTNGGAEAIALVAAEVGGHVEGPEFALYRRHLTGDGGGGRWRSNPHNPTGLLAPAGDTAAVWDEAFWPLATGTWTRGDAHNGAVVLGSLTKLLACPGLRIGYVMTTDEDLVARLTSRQPQWSLNGLAAAALPELLATVDLAGWAEAVRRLRDDLAAVLRSHGLEPRSSDANWLLVEAPGLRERLAPHAVLVRDCASFGMDGVMRIAVPDAAGLARLDAALALAEATASTPITARGADAARR